MASGGEQTGVQDQIQFGNRAPYCLLNQQVPVLRLYLDGRSDLRPDFRLNRQTLTYLINTLREDRDHGWGQDLEILVFIFWLASATSYRVVCRAFDMPRSTVHMIVHKVSKMLLHIKHKVIHFPSFEELEEISTGFANLAGSPVFGSVAGSIDGCHIRIKPPSADSMCYLNRKLFYSIQLQALCDHRGKYLDIFVGYPGSVHDSRVLRNSPIYLKALYPPERYHILGDGGFPCLSHPISLITPYREPLQNASQRRFNFHHAKARSIIERSFGCLKTRWRSLFFKDLEVKPEFAPEVITCCTILHNICITNGDITEPEEGQLDGDDLDDLQVRDPQSGEHTRERLAAALSAPNEDNLPPALRHHDYL
ncbi:hypothetical protein H4Q32_026905 [Labeo rohita]|uniref:Putative nuclease HARBI1 n=1 Tax=Labeo rohita TaxID=84645 RepID=A0ABQ8L6V7_LABRO|nr:hypothetical protein H4Q32_026905 [Labeo rohita]